MWIMSPGCVFGIVFWKSNRVLVSATYLRKRFCLVIVAVAQVALVFFALLFERPWFLCYFLVWRMLYKSEVRFLQCGFFYTALKGVMSENEEDCADVTFMKLDDQRKRGAHERPLAVCQAWAQSNLWTTHSCQAKCLSFIAEGDAGARMRSRSSRGPYGCKFRAQGIAPSA